MSQLTLSVPIIIVTDLYIAFWVLLYFSASSRALECNLLPFYLNLCDSCSYGFLFFINILHIISSSFPMCSFLLCSHKNIPAIDLKDAFLRIQDFFYLLPLMSRFLIRKIQNRHCFKKLNLCLLSCFVFLISSTCFTYMLIFNKFYSDIRVL
jgi:hypothetical protein